MTITHKHPVYTDEASKRKAINKKFNTVYGAIIEKRNNTGLSDRAVAV